MKKEQIVTRIRDASDTLNKKQSAELVNKLLDILRLSLKEGEGIKISSFGRFYVHRRKPRKGRNPKTGEEADITEGKTIKFKHGRPLKLSVLK